MSDDELAARFRELSELLGRDGPPDAERVVAFAARAVPHGEHCGLMLRRGTRRPSTVAWSGELVRQVDAIEYETGEGPCLDVVRGDDLVRADDLAEDPQWPAFGRRCAAETGVRSMFSIRLELADDDRAALNFYAHAPGTFDDLDVGTGALVAPFAGLAVQNALYQRDVGNLRFALESNRMIGTAIGVLMTRRLVTADEAFSQLVEASQGLNRKLRDIAAEVTETGTLPAPPPGRRGQRSSGSTLEP